MPAGRRARDSGRSGSEGRGQGDDGGELGFGVLQEAVHVRCSQHAHRGVGNDVADRGHRGQAHGCGTGGHGGPRGDRQPAVPHDTSVPLRAPNSRTKGAQTGGASRVTARRHALHLRRLRSAQRLRWGHVTSAGGGGRPGHPLGAHPCPDRPRARRRLGAERDDRAAGSDQRRAGRGDPRPGPARPRRRRAPAHAAGSERHARHRGDRPRRRRAGGPRAGLRRRRLHDQAVLGRHPGRPDPRGPATHGDQRTELRARRRRAAPGHPRPDRRTGRARHSSSAPASSTCWPT